MSPKKKKAKKSVFKLDLLIFPISVGLFIVSYAVNENMIFEKYFSEPLHRAVAAVQKLNSDKELNLNDRGFPEITKFFADPQFASGAVTKIKIMGEEIALAAPANISKHTYWLYNKDDQKIGEEIVGDAVLSQKITDVYFNEPLTKILKVKRFFQVFFTIELLFLQAWKLYFGWKD